MKLIDAMRTNDAFTENGMTTNSTSLNLCVDLFFKIGALRGKGKRDKINAFSKAFGENPLLAMKILFWARDIRGGAGERETFREIVVYLSNNHPDVLGKNLNLFSEFGRWDDLLVLIGTKLENEVLVIIKSALDRGDGLCSKWLPRGNTKNRERKLWAKAIRNYLGLSPKEYRTLLVGLSNTVEQLMCAKKFDAITYSHVPSKAMSDYMKSFSRNDTQRFGSYLQSVEKGEATINAGAVYPYDIIKSLKQGNSDGANAQWGALPNYLEGNGERLLPLVDVSGSMTCPAGGSKSVTCMDVAISLGLYISERNVGAFKDAFLTFTSQPKLEVLKGSLNDRFTQLSRADWGGSTNIQAAFETILTKAKSSDVLQSDMPTMLLILSDMQFDFATGNNGWGVSHPVWNPSAQQMVEKMYADSGYKMPKLVYWNLNSRNDNSPVSFDKQGTALVSGFSVSLLKNLLGGKDMTPLSMMMDIVNSDRYDSITI
jgi:hypothetical protein